MRRIVRRAGVAIGRATSVSRATWRRVLLLVGPLTVQVLLFKLIQHAVLYGSTQGVSPAIDQADLASVLFVEHAAVPLLLGAVSGFLVLLVLLRRPALGVVGLPAFLACFAGLAALSQPVLPFGTAWFSGHFAEVVRWDVCGLLALAGVFLLLIEHTRGRVRAAVLALLHGLVLALMLLASLEFGYFAQTGSLADTYLLRYSLSNLADLASVISHEMTGGQLVFLALPFAVVALPLVVERSAGRQAALLRRQPALFGYVALPLLVLLALPRAAVPEAVRPVEGNTFVRLFADFFRGPPLGGAGLPAAAGAEVPLFDTQALRLAATDSLRPLNVVLVVLESQRSPARHPKGVTPFLDALQRQALVVDEMYAVVPHTNKALVPILCGIFPRLRQGGAPRLPGACLPALLAPLGYASAFFTPATLAFENKGAMLRNMGFEEVYGNEAFDRQGFDKINYFGFDDRIMLAPSLAWVDRQRHRDKPFLLTYLTLAPHHPYALPRSAKRHAFVADNPTYNKYLNTLAYVDAFLAELFAAFEARGLMEETLFVLVGDHGEAFGEHGRRHHSAVVWDESLHVRALLYQPRLFPEAVHVAGPRQQIDLLPTLAGLLGARLEGGFLPGVSLLEPVPAGRTLYHACWIENQSMALRQGTTKFIYHFRRAPMEVYDVAADPLEKNNLAARYPSDRLEAATYAMLRWRRRVNDRYRK